MNISKPVLFAIILSIVGVIASSGLYVYKSNLSSLKLEDTESKNNKTLQEIVNTGLNCDIQAPDGTVTTDNCTISVVLGNYAKGIMPQGYWIAVRTDTTWKIVVTGNGIPACAEIDSHTIPKEIYGNCIEASGELRF